MDQRDYKVDPFLAHLLNMEDSDTEDMRAFYEREQRREVTNRRLRLGWRIIKGALMLLGFLVILAFCAALWLLPGGLP